MNQEEFAKAVQGGCLYNLERDGDILVSVTHLLGSDEGDKYILMYIPVIGMSLAMIEDLAGKPVSDTVSNTPAVYEIVGFDYLVDLLDERNVDWGAWTSDPEWDSPFESGVVGVMLQMVAHKALNFSFEDSDTQHKAELN